MELSELRFKRMARCARPRGASILGETDAGVADEEQNIDITVSRDDSSHLPSHDTLRRSSVGHALCYAPSYACLVLIFIFRSRRSQTDEAPTMDMDAEEDIYKDSVYALKADP